VANSNPCGAIWFMFNLNVRYMNIKYNEGKTLKFIKKKGLWVLYVQQKDNSYIPLKQHNDNVWNKILKKTGR
jgi:hypothetical protein